MLFLISSLAIIMSILLIGVVLLQPGKGDMLTGMSGIGGQFNSMFGSRRATDLLMKLTIGFATTIAVLSLVANIFFVNRQVTTIKPAVEGRSIPSTSAPAPAALPVAPPTEPAPAK